MKYRHLFFDLDHTLWDFDSNARVTLEAIYEDLQLKTRGIDDFELFYRNYLGHNEKLWERYRRGYIRQDELRVKRMWLSLLDFKIADDALSKAMSVQFLDLLPTRTILFPHAKEVLQYLKDKNYELHLITNGFEKVQHSKLRNSGLDIFFGEVITSEGSNSLKPNKEIFDYAFNKTGAVAATSIMLGDTLDVDIQGAINAGMDQVFVNHLGIKPEIKPTYMVNSLKELEEIF
ncbi:YjjG family noncanonical pyrimidine nucleotidase [Terrimonas sp. NA20]|uniref:YjjG family noncanonical pyrimidine nucleotidase n=1 Tax=Terrimonas ginsenosidimutans TaxID=2908004 RepID=A0ABS9KZC0_9BACT|nr:YjjG family noncanonical pyrimidine nucleotidase [Terrimonas ginsenosidimutans]MCG2617608.1 YjjG family noncanonical pyrimidine nucleotidase [Terrimonas ginsenosidimutans]